MWTFVRRTLSALHFNRDSDGHFVGLFGLTCYKNIMLFLGYELIACLIFLVIGFRLNTATESSLANLGVIVRVLRMLSFVECCVRFCLAELLDIKFFFFRQAEKTLRKLPGSRLLFLAQFLKSRIAAQRIPHGIETEQCRSEWRLRSGGRRDCFPQSGDGMVGFAHTGRNLSEGLDHNRAIQCVLLDRHRSHGPFQQIERRRFVTKTHIR